MRSISSRRRLLFTTALAAAALTNTVWAQEQPREAGGVLDEIVVTATRQADTASRVPLSITAVTQKSLEQQSIKTVQDLSRTIPAVTFRRSGNDNVPNVAIRGITGQLGAATTGVYLDDTPLQKRGTIGVVTGGGSPFPILYDLERVEVLKGPQGTLFGASSEGGTVRFITPAPSLVAFTGNARTELSTTKGGGVTYEAGAAMGGPLIRDKLGFRLSLFERKTGGWIDHVSYYDGHTFDKNTNSGEQRAVRFALTWAPTERLRITPAYYYSLDHSDDLDTYWRDIPQYTVNPGVFTNVVAFNGSLPAAARFNFDLPDKAYAGGTYGPWKYGPGKIGTGFYVDESHQVLPLRSQRTTKLHIPSLTIDYDFGAFNVKSISSYVYDITDGPVQTSAGLRGTNFAPNAGMFTDDNRFLSCAQIPGAACGGTSGYVIPGTNTPVPGGFGAAPIYFNGQPFTFTEYDFYNVRRSFTQEIRFSSNPGDSRFSWVAGGYFNRAHQRQPGSVLSNENEIIYGVRGIDEAFATFMPNLSGTIFNPGNPPVAQINYTILNPTTPRLVNGVPTYDVVQNGKTDPRTGTDVSRRLAILNEKEWAAFAEVNYLITRKLKITAGARYSQVRTNYTQIQSGPVFNIPLPTANLYNPTAANPNPPVPAGYFVPTPGHPFPNRPGDAYDNVASGSLKEKPFNPKIGVSWQATETNLFYATIARGYRAGSVNTPGTLAQCANDVAALGQPTPLTYKSDSVTSYETGAKVRMFGNRLAINGSAFYIDWKDPQLTVTLACAFQYVTNAKGAVSKGFDFQGQFRVVKGLTVSFAAGYTDAHYTDDFSFKAANGSTTYIVRKGGELGVPKWQYNIGAQYDFDLFTLPGYIRADYQYSDVYQRGQAKGTAAYNPWTVKGRETKFMTARAGITYKKVDASVFVNNVTNSQDMLNETNTTASPLRTATTFRPREIGVQLSYRY
jgi:outer membrane receptor protein involved in Fe transport